MNVPCSREGEQSKPEAVLGNTLPQIPSFLLCAESSRFRGSRIFNSPFSTAMPAGAVVASTIWAPPPEVPCQQLVFMRCSSAFFLHWRPKRLGRADLIQSDS